MDVFEWLWMWVLDGWVCVGDPLMRWVSVAGFWWGGRGPPFILNSEVFFFAGVKILWGIFAGEHLSHVFWLVRTWCLNPTWWLVRAGPCVLIGKNLMTEFFLSFPVWNMSSDWSELDEIILPETSGWTVHPDWPDFYFWILRVDWSELDGWTVRDDWSEFIM